MHLAVGDLGCAEFFLDPTFVRNLRQMPFGRVFLDWKVIGYGVIYGIT